MVSYQHFPSEEDNGRSSFMKHYSWTLNSEFNTSNLHFPWMLKLNYTWWFRQWLLSLEQMGPFPSSESSLISYPLREGGMMLKTAMQAVESKPRILFEREWKVLAQVPSSSEISLGNKSLGITAHLPLPFHFLTYSSWFVKDGTLPHCYLAVFYYALAWPHAFCLQTFPSLKGMAILPTR